LDTGHCGAISEVAKKNKVVYFAAFCQSPVITGEYFHPHIARATTMSTQYIKALAKFAGKNLKGKTKWAGIVPNDDYGKSVWRDFQEELRKNNPNIKITGEYLVMPTDMDLTAYITQLAASGSDAVFSGLWAVQSVTFIKQATGFGLFKKMSYVGNSAGTREEIMALGPDVVDGAVGVSGLPWEENNYEKKYPAVAKWVEKFKTATGKDPNTITDWAYRSVHGLAEAIKIAKSTKSDDIVKALDKGYTFKTPWSETTMRGCDHQASVKFSVGYVRKDKANKKGRFEAVEVYDGIDFQPTCESLKASKSK
jgi:branched-chain amino acid transport system substrate-binding protein